MYTKLNWANSMAVMIFTIIPLLCIAQYRVDFNGDYQGFEPNNLKDWRTATGDGNIIFRQKFEEGSVALSIDPLRDKKNIWYAFMHQSISDHIDFEKLKQPGYELRMEAKVMPSHAPRRINMYLSSLDSGGFLREFDLDKANEWHTISMVTSGFDFDPNIPLMTQVSMMDWGISEIYELKIDYIKVDLVKVTDDPKQFGEPLIYRPSLKTADVYPEILLPSKNAMIDSKMPNEALTGWSDEVEGKAGVLQVDQSKTVLLQWDFSKYKGKKVAEAGQLELSTNTLLRKRNSQKDFGEIRCSEILNVVDPWDDATVTYNSFLGDNAYYEAIVSQCIVDTKVNPQKNGKTVVSISRRVLQRLLDGKTDGIALKALGLISASFFDTENEALAPKLRFTVE